MYVSKRVNIPEDCTTCLYGPNSLDWRGQPVNRCGCAHSGHQTDYIYRRLTGFCPDWWLDQHRFTEVRP